MSEARVVLIGWHGSTERQLRPIDRLHTQRGRVVEVVIPESTRALATPFGFARQGLRLATRLDEMHTRDPRPLVFHSFSNGGFWTLAALVQALAATPSLADAHVLTILDSAPGFPDRVRFTFTARTAPMAFMPGILRALGRPPALHHPWLTPPLTIAFGLWHLASPIQVRFMERARPVLRAFHRRSGTARPLLALYGGADPLIPIEHVESFLAACESEGIPTERLFFPTSSHVRHVFAHRDAYMRAVDDAIARASALAH